MKLFVRTVRGKNKNEMDLDTNRKMAEWTLEILKDLDKRISSHWSDRQNSVDDTAPNYKKSTLMK